MDAVEANLDKMKQQNADVLQGKAVHKKKKKKLLTTETCSMPKAKIAQCLFQI